MTLPDDSDSSSLHLQYKNWLICQRCGRIAPKGTEDWLDSPWLKDKRFNVVRCPIHWSDEALRNSEARRTDENRTKVWKLKRKYKHWRDEKQPFQTLPLRDVPIGTPWPQSAISDERHARGSDGLPKGVRPIVRRMISKDEAMDE